MSSRLRIPSWPCRSCGVREAKPEIQPHGVETNVKDRFAPEWILAAQAWIVVRLVMGLAWLVTETSWFASVATKDSTKSLGLFLWDGTYYRDIAKYGYADLDEFVRRFFPAYPLLGRAGGWLLGNRPDIALVLLSNAAAFAASILLYRLVVERMGDERLARLSVWCLALWPASAAFGWVYAEAFAMAFACGAMLAFSRGHHGRAAVLAMLASLSRPTGVLLCVVFALEAAPQMLALIRGTGSGEDESPQAKKTLVGRAIATSRLLVVVSSPAIGLGLYLLWLQDRFGTYGSVTEAQAQYRAGWHEPFSRFGQAVLEVATGDRRDVINLGFAVVVIAALVVGRRRLPLPWLIGLGATLLVSLSANNIDSLGRYSLSSCALPVALAALVQYVCSLPLLKHHQRSANIAAFSASSAFLGLYCVLAWSGRMIP